MVNLATMSCILSQQHHACMACNLQAIEKFYQQKGALEGPDQPLDFESEEVRLDVPWPAGVKLEGGWKLTPLTNPVVS